MYLFLTSAASFAVKVSLRLRNNDVPSTPRWIRHTMRLPLPPCRDLLPLILFLQVPPATITLILRYRIATHMQPGQFRLDGIQPPLNLSTLQLAAPFQNPPNLPVARMPLFHAPPQGIMKSPIFADRDYP